MIFEQIVAMKRGVLYFFLLSASLSWGQSPDPLLFLQDREGQQKWVDSIYSNLSLQEKVGQLFMPMVFSKQDTTHYQFTLDLIEKHKLGGLVFSLGGPVEQTQWLNSFQAASKTPLLIAMDAEWGVAMRLDSVSAFPWPMTLGAVKDTTLLRAIGQRMGMQEKRLGIHYSFSPVLDINTNPKNPIIGNRSFGASAERVIRQASAVMEGHHQAGILTSGKHFPGHGDTAQDSHKTLPTVSFSEARIKEIELEPFSQLIRNGLSSVMVAHLNVPSIAEEGLPSSLSKEIIQGLLKKELDFKGLVVTDALNMKGVSEYSKVENIDLTAFLAGHDILLISNDIPLGIKAIMKAYKKGVVSEERLAYSVKKILKAKYKVGLNKAQAIDTKNLIEDLNTEQDEHLYYQVMGKALTLLQNENKLIPLPSVTNLGHIALGDASGAAFFEQLNRYESIKKIENVTPSNVLERTSENDTIIVSFHRSNATPWKASDFSKNTVNIISNLAEHKTVILNVFVKPYALAALEGIQGIDALLLSYQNSSIAQKLSADAIFGAQSIEGSLPVNVSKSFKEGAGLTIESNYRLGVALPSELGFEEEKLKAVEQLAKTAIDSMMTPGMNILISRKGKVVYNKSFGYHTYKKEQLVKRNDLYDLASLTKILGTLPLVMQEVEKGKLTMETTIADLLPAWKDSDKAAITLKRMLSHQARLFPWIPFYKETLDSDGFPKKSMYKTKPSNRYSLPVTQSLFLNSKFEEEMYKQIKESKLLEPDESKYSDLPYYILKAYFENQTGKEFNQLVQERIFSPLGLNIISYNPLNLFSKNEIVPSEIDNYFRHSELHGYVHDMGAAMQKGVGGHAGLFGDAYSVAAIMQMYLQQGSYNGLDFVEGSVIDAFNKAYFRDLGNRRGIGFDKPQLEGKHQSTCGCISDFSFGHSGYTGTFAWADPEKEIIIVILANRTYPNDDKTFSKNNIRTRIQEAVYEALIY